MPGPASSRSSPSRPASRGSGGTATSTARCPSVTNISPSWRSTQRRPSGCWRGSGTRPHFGGSTSTTLALTPSIPSWRHRHRETTPRINEYNTRAHAEHSVLEDPTSAAALQGQSLLLRKFDEANRDRQKIEGQLQFAFANGFTATPSAAWRFDNYTASPLGLKNETGWSVGIDLGWTLIDRVTFSGGYTYEQFLQKMRSRSRPVNGTVT